MMKAIQLLEKDRIELRDVPVPEIGPDEMLIRVRAASICGTDVRMWKNGYKNVSPENPLTMGHEFAGDIAKLGGNVTGYSVGQRVAVAPNYGCGTCDLCASGNTHLCETYDAFGVTVDGGFAEYVKIPAAAIRQGNISPMDDDITYQEAALLEPLSCVYNGQLLIGVDPADARPAHGRAEDRDDAAGDGAEQRGGGADALFVFELFIERIVDHAHKEAVQRAGHEALDERENRVDADEDDAHGARNADGEALQIAQKAED